MSQWGIFQVTCSYRNRSTEHNFHIEIDLMISENKWTTKICDEKNQVGDCMLQMAKRCNEVLWRCGSMEGMKGFRVRYCLYLCLGPSDPEYLPLLRNFCPPSLLKKSWKERLQRIAWDFEKKNDKDMTLTHASKEDRNLSSLTSKLTARWIPKQKRQPLSSHQLAQMRSNLYLYKWGQNMRQVSMYPWIWI